MNAHASMNVGSCLLGSAAILYDSDQGLTISEHNMVQYPVVHATVSDADLDVAYPQQLIAGDAHKRYSIFSRNRKVSSTLLVGPLRLLASFAYASYVRGNGRQEHSTFSAFSLCQPAATQLLMRDAG